MNKIKVGILGATGSVGQKFVSLLSEHPIFEINELVASERSAGKSYKDAVKWILEKELEQNPGNKIVKKAGDTLESKVLFSALDSGVAGELEEFYAKQGHAVISNARNHRFDPDVPLIIPEVNPEHLDLIKYQKYGDGFIVTNPNCSTIGAVLALKPLHDLFGIEKLNIVTMQAMSGAGYPGLSSMDIFDNVVPFISGEEEKIETEPNKIFGTLSVDGKIDNACINISAQCNRVNVIDGHLETVQVTFGEKVRREQIISAWASFESIPYMTGCYSAPKNPIRYFDEEYYPQPRIHRNIDNGMTTSTGRLREDKFFDFKFVVLSHNTVRGAAGGTILIAELMEKKGIIK